MVPGLPAAAGMLTEPVWVRESWTSKNFSSSQAPAAVCFPHGLFRQLGYFSLKHTYLQNSLQGPLRKGAAGQEKKKRKRKRSMQ